MTTTITTLTTGTLDGTGVFDKLMAATKAHLDAEFKKGTIKGPEYSTVYLGQMQAVLQASIQFVAEQQKIDLEAQLLQAQIANTQAQTDLVRAQIDNAKLSDGLTQAQIDLAKENVLLAAQNLEIAKLQGQNIPKEGAKLDAETCLLKSQFDASQAGILSTEAQTTLLNQKTATEKAQITELGVDDNSVIGKQKKLYQAQTDGFTRDAEQKAAKLMLDTWNARRMTDDATVADGTNQLNDVTIGRFVTMLANGVKA